MQVKWKYIRVGERNERMRVSKQERKQLDKKVRMSQFFSISILSFSLLALFRKGEEPPASNLIRPESLVSCSFPYSSYLLQWWSESSLQRKTSFSHLFYSFTSVVECVLYFPSLLSLLYDFLSPPEQFMTGNGFPILEQTRNSSRSHFISTFLSIAWFSQLWLRNE